MTGLCFAGALAHRNNIKRHKMRIIFIGPPGAGKGTQSKRVVEFLQVPHISTGEMLRNTMTQQSSLAELVRRQMKGGRLVEDKIVVQMVGQRLSEPDCQNGYMLDGFPRTLCQATAFNELLVESGEHIDAVLSLEVPKDILFERLLARAELEGRQDDNAATIRQRMQVFDDQTSPLLDFYQAEGILHRIDGLGSPNDVFERIQSVFEMASKVVLAQRER